MKEEFCCHEMKSNLKDDDIAIKYISKFREYGISYLDGTNSIQEIFYCPWCGNKLPESLRTSWFEELGKIGCEPEDILNGNGPASFKSDQWWKERDL